MTIGFYDQYYRNMDPHFIRWREVTGRIKADNIIRICQERKIGSVLEIGCGTGIILKTLSENGFGERYHALDVSESALEYVKSQSIRGLVETKAGDAMNISYGDKSFDLAILSHILEHLQNPAGALREAERVARLVVIEVPLEEHFFGHIRRKAWKILRRDENTLPERKIGHIQSFNRKSVVRIAESCGLSVEKARIVYLPAKILFFNSRTPAAKLKSAVKVVLQGISRVIRRPLISVNFIMLCKEKNRGHVPN